MMVRKVIRDGKVAVLYSPGFGAGWSTWSSISGHGTELMFDPSVVTLVEDRDNGKITTDQLVELVNTYCEITYGKNEVYCGGVDNLEIVWIPEGTQFKINEYDGSESIEYKENDYWITA
jgi:hypothetical protein